ncbi:MAG TPA: hypothetical protein VGB52_07775 [Actinomycetota bacterium]|jgi:hypothetical protein
MSIVVRLGIVATVALMTVSAAVAAPPAEHRVFTDPVNDGDPLQPDATPPFQDLIAGYISETDDAIEFSWQVVDIDDVATSKLALFHWEFALGATTSTILPCTAEGNRCFSVRASFDIEGAGLGALESNCTGTPVVTCELLDAQVTVSIDPDANTVTASVLRADLGDPADGEIMAEVELFRGIAAFTRLGLPPEGQTTSAVHSSVTQPVIDQVADASPVGLPTSLVCSCVMDVADTDAAFYVLGSNRI